MRKIIFQKLCFTFILFFIISSESPAQGISAFSKANEEAIIILATDTITEMQYARRFAEEAGCIINEVFPPGVFIGKVPQDAAVKLKKLSYLFKEVSYVKIELTAFENKGYEASCLDAIKLWNERLSQTKKAKIMTINPQKQVTGPFRDYVVMPPDLPKTKEEKIKKNKEYWGRWEKKKTALQLLEEKKMQKRLQKQRATKEIQSTSLALFQKAKALSSGIGAKSRAYGASIYDTSLYMTGDIAVAVFFVPSAEETPWPTAEIDSVYESIVNALKQFQDGEPNAKITFYFKKETDPRNLPSQITYWNSQYPPQEPEKEREYVNDLRETFKTHWAFMVKVFYKKEYKKDDRAWAYLWGPSVTLFSQDLRQDYVARHETMHIFGANDQYYEASISPVDRFGYLNVVNANSQYNDGKGYFNGAGEGAADIMISEGPIGAYSRGQIGWRDADGDGILDPLETFPDTVSLSKTGNNPFAYTGKAQDKPILNANPKLVNNPGIYGDVTLNTISKVEYRINGGAWSQAQAKDGKFDSAEEEFIFTLPALKNGRYSVEVRATNSVGNAEISYAQDNFAVAGSAVTNVRPFASFSIKPPQGSINTNFTFDASSSSDIENSSSQLQVRWDFEGDGIWDSAFSTNKTTSFKYSTGGAKTVKLEVKDSQGLTNVLTKQLEVKAANLPPYAFFVVSPENQHGDLSDTFMAAVDASGSYSNQNANSAGLQARWDFDDDGVWDTEYLSYLKNEHSYRVPFSLSLPPPLQVATPSAALDIFASGNYAYIANSSSGLQVMDISNPRSPTIIGGYNCGYAQKVFVQGRYAYIAAGNSGLQIIDTADPRSPRLMGSCPTPDSASSVYVSGNYAYMTDRYGGMLMVDVSKPNAPVLTKTYNPSGSAQQAFREGNYFRDVYVLGHYAYLASVNGGLEILDVTNPNLPLAGRFLPVGCIYGITIAGNYAYLAEGNRIEILDISNPLAPLLVGSCNDMSGAQKVYIYENYAYVADMYAGLLVIDISNPRSPVPVVRCKTMGKPSGVSVLANYAYIADSNSGIQVIDISRPFKSSALPVSKHYRIKVEIKDTSGNLSQATRDIWIVTYNHKPIMEDVGSIKTLTFDLLGNRSILGNASSIFISANYAYITKSDDKKGGFEVINIANPTAPLTSVTVSPQDDYNVFCKVYVSENYAYIAKGNRGLQIYDISNPLSPVKKGAVTMPGTWWQKYTLDVCVAGNYAYLTTAGGLHIVDISNPTEPALVGGYPTSDATQQVSVSSGYAYVADALSGIQVIDVSNPRSPSLVRSCKASRITSSSFILGHYLYVAAYESGMLIYDIVNPGNPSLVGICNTPGGAVNIYVSGNYAYIADSKEGIQVADVSNPYAPMLIGKYDTQNTVCSIFVSGNYVYALQSDSLKILRPIWKSEFGAKGSSDPDINTTWDGLLEYRWDFGNDGLWDTKFSPSNLIPLDSLSLPAACQVRDRFGATKTITAGVPNVTITPGTISGPMPKDPPRSAPTPTIGSDPSRIKAQASSGQRQESGQNQKK
ncbi:MAG: PKD domain-containing protein [Candidatus Omnitrophota bacterium]